MILERSKGLRIRRGDIYLVNLGDTNNKNLTRPVLVIQNDIGNRYCPTIIVVPLLEDTKLKKLFISVLIKAEPRIGINQDYIALLSQVRTIDKSFFNQKNYLGHLDIKNMEKVDKALEISLGLSTLQKLEDRMEYNINRIKNSKIS